MSLSKQKLVIIEEIIYNVITAAKVKRDTHECECVHMNIMV